MNRVLLLPGWGFGASVFDSLKHALGREYECCEADIHYTPSGQPLPGGLVNQASSADVLLGWSLGGLFALQLALQLQHRDVRLVLLATTPCFTERDDWDAGMPMAEFNEFRQLVVDDPATGLKQFVRLNAGARMNPELRRQLLDNTAAPDREALLAGLSLLAETDLRDDVAGLRSRILVMQARDDRLVSPHAGQWLSAQAPNAQLIENETGGHAFFLSAPERVAEAIWQWQ